MKENTHIEPTLPWAAAREAFISAFANERLFEEMVVEPLIRAEQEVPDEVTDEQDRLTDIRCDAEHAMIAAIAPDMQAVLIKIEYARHRWDHCVDWPSGWWDAVLADLRRSATDRHMGWLAERDELLRRYNAMPNAFDDGLDILRAAQDLERRIQDTPAAGRDGLLAKALLVVAEGVLGMDEPAKAVFSEAKALGVIEFAS